MHGMLASFAEYYSNNLATEIMKGLSRKHEQGGTPFKAATSGGKHDRPRPRLRRFLRNRPPHPVRTLFMLLRSLQAHATNASDHGNTADGCDL
jgi:hypothetical protein